jgi:intein-encoded DNA endonuclease-like protein
MKDEEIVHANMKILELLGFLMFFDKIKSMNWNYISGFFDADGSITLSKPSNSKFKTVFISFHNNELAILEAIRDFIYKELQIKGVIVTKTPKKENHNIAYDLKYDFLEKTVMIIKKMKLLHPKKKHRIKMTLALHAIVPRNGKYSSSMLLTRQKIEEDFFKV